MLPPWATSTGIFRKLHKSLYGYKTYDLRGTKQSVGQAAISFTGLNISDADPEAGQSFNALQFGKKIKDSKTAYRKAMMEAARRNKSPEEVASIRKDFKSTQSQLNKRIQEYKKSIGQ